jgi:hypothetical protein
MRVVGKELNKELSENLYSTGFGMPVAVRPEYPGEPCGLESVQGIEVY